MGILGSKENNLDSEPFTRMKRPHDSDLLSNKDYSGTIQDDVCAICLSEIDHSELYRLGCNHVYHKDCVNDMIDRGFRSNGSISCPMCRTDVDSFNSNRKRGIMDEPNTKRSRMLLGGILGYQKKKKSKSKKRKRSSRKRRIYKKRTMP